VALAKVIVTVITATTASVAATVVRAKAEKEKQISKKASDGF